MAESGAPRMLRCDNLMESMNRPASRGRRLHILVSTDAALLGHMPPGLLLRDLLQDGFHHRQRWPSFPLRRLQPPCLCRRKGCLPRTCSHVSRESRDGSFRPATAPPSNARGCDRSRIRGILMRISSKPAPIANQVIGMACGRALEALPLLGTIKQGIRAMPDVELSQGARRGQQ